MIAEIKFELHPVSAERRTELDAHPPVTVTEWFPVMAIACGFFVRDHSRGLEDYRKLSQMLGLDAPVTPPKTRKAPKPTVKVDGFRRGKKGRQR